MNELKLLVEMASDLVALYVEDHDDTREEIECLLESIFGKVIVAKDGLEALQKYENNQIDIVITDINMPKMDGLSMIKEIRKENKDIKIIVFSAYENVEYLSECIDQGVDGFLTKPLDEKKYFSTLYKVVEQMQMKKELLEYKNSLEIKVQEQLDELVQKDDILKKNAKFAAMGEMIDVVAHQWKGPLNIISLRTGFINELAKTDGFVETSELIECTLSVNTQINHLVETLDHFRSFLRPDSNLEEIQLDDLYDGLKVLLKDQLLKYQISLEKEFENVTFLGNLTEIKHIFINLINNAKDAFIQNDIKDRKILIEAKNSAKKLTIKIKDNAGGIPDNIVEKIFEANFTTKQGIGGTGIGLYMCQMIADKYNYSLDVRVDGDKSEFILEIPH